MGSKTAKTAGIGLILAVFGIGAALVINQYVEHRVNREVKARIKNFAIAHERTWRVDG